MGKRFALVVGNGAFATGSGFSPLRCATKDAMDLCHVLSAEKHGGFEAICLQDATQREIMKAVSTTLRAASGPDDLVLIYYSGHGKPDEEGNLYLAASDSEAEELSISAVAVDFIGSCMKRSRAEKIALILDCCYSGAVAKFFTKGEVSDQIKTSLPKELQGRGTYVLTASTDTQVAEEKEADVNSLLTKHILSGISEGLADTNDDGIITMHELLLYVQAGIKNEGSQEPMGFALRMGGGDLPIAMTGKPKFDLRRRAVEASIYSARTDHHLPALIRDRALAIVSRAGYDEPAKASLDRLYQLRANPQDFIDLLFELCVTDNLQSNAGRDNLAATAYATASLLGDAVSSPSADVADLESSSSQIKTPLISASPLDPAINVIRQEDHLVREPAGANTDKSVERRLVVEDSSLLNAVLSRGSALIWNEPNVADDSPVTLPRVTRKVWIKDQETLEEPQELFKPLSAEKVSDVVFLLGGVIVVGIISSVVVLGYNHYDDTLTSLAIIVFFLVLVVASVVIKRKTDKDI